MRKFSNEISYKNVENYIKTLVVKSPNNTLSPAFSGPIFEEPVIGIANGYDPLFQQFKNIIGEFHLTPLEFLQKTFEEVVFQKTDLNLSVVCWVLPFSNYIKNNNASHRGWPPSHVWSYATEYGEKLNNEIRHLVARFFNECGHLAIAPVLSPLWQKPNRYVSNWSERHALFVAGMGTFGLSDNFITERGVAMRCGSVIVNCKLPPSPRLYKSHTENCVFYSFGKCGKCISRCPAGAITPAGHDKIKCREYRDILFSELREKYQIEKEPEGCGLCQTGVPCESEIPSKK
jgi:epoxyqueuosine reductase